MAKMGPVGDTPPTPRANAAMIDVPGAVALLSSMSSTLKARLFQANASSSRCARRVACVAEHQVVTLVVSPNSGRERRSNSDSTKPFGSCSNNPPAL